MSASTPSFLLRRTSWSSPFERFQQAFERRNRDRGGLEESLDLASKQAHSLPCSVGVRGNCQRPYLSLQGALPVTDCEPARYPTENQLQVEWLHANAQGPQRGEPFSDGADGQRHPRKVLSHRYCSMPT